MTTPFIASIDWNQNGQPISTQFGDVYFSSVSGIDESRYVFLQSNKLAERFKQLSPTDSFTIAETGFGSGLNFLCAYQCWQENAISGAQLNFISVEKFPLQVEDLHTSLNLWPELKPWAEQLCQCYPPVNARGLHKLKFNNNVNLTLIYEDAVVGFRQLLPIHSVGPKVIANGYGWSDCAEFKGLVDAWFLDGFAPAKNPEMWTNELFDVMARLSFTSKTGEMSVQRTTSFSTFTAAGSVRRGLIEAGFQVEKIPGFGRKREMLKGFYSDHPTNATKQSSTAHVNTLQNHTRRIKADPSWHLATKNQKPPKHIAVIGAGLAGCHTANALANKGFKVSVIERNEIASGASGNPQGILYSKFSDKQGIFTDFSLSAYLFACHFYQQNNYFANTGSHCGVLQLAQSLEQEKQYQSIASTFKQSPSLLSWLSAEHASKKSGVELVFGGLWLPQAGWFHPQKLCRQLLQHPNITVVENTAIEKLVYDSQYNNSHWQLHSSDSTSHLIADNVVISCAYSASLFEQCNSLPIKTIRGQVSYIAATDTSQTLNTVLCGTGYIAPAVNQQHCIGATFNLKENTEEIRWQDHETNLLNAGLLSPDFQSLSNPKLEQGRVSFRCTTPDYLPIVGPVANEATMLKRFEAYRKNFKTTIDAPGEYWPGLYINIAHASKGLTYTPICADLIACMITGAPLPLTRDLAVHVHSARFLMRDLARNRR